MPLSLLLAIILVIAVVGYVLGRQRALASAGGDSRGLHSLPVYYGSNVLLSVIVPAFGFLILALILIPVYIDSHVSSMITEADVREGSSLGLVMAEVRRVAEGLDNAVEAFKGMLKGKNFDKQLVHIAD